MARFLPVLTQLDDYAVVHFGRYEKDFIQRDDPAIWRNDGNRSKDFYLGYSMSMQPYAPTSSSPFTATASRRSLRSGVSMAGADSIWN